MYTGGYFFRGHSVVTMGLSCTVSQINDNFSRKSQFFTTLVYLTPPLVWFPLEFL